MCDLQQYGGNGAMCLDGAGGSGAGGAAAAQKPHVQLFGEVGGVAQTSGFPIGQAVRAKDLPCLVRAAQKPLRDPANVAIASGKCNGGGGAPSGDSLIESAPANSTPDALNGGDDPAASKRNLILGVVGASAAALILLYAFSAMRK